MSYLAVPSAESSLLTWNAMLIVWQISDPRAPQRKSSQVLRLRRSSWRMKEKRDSSFFAAARKRLSVWRS